MQTRNNYQLEWEIKGRYNTVIDRGTGVFNGDTGVIREINTAVSEVTVEYDDSKMVGYPFADLDELELAYAMTIHKSQGSEYPVVILPLLSGPQVLMNRNLLYTAVTRAKRCVVIIGSRDTVNNMIKNVSPTTRYSGLRDAVDDIYAADEDLK
jgi:exodeoxyribonuclease V alpha subunit